MVVEGSMTQGASQGPTVRTATLRDFRVPAYVQQAGPPAATAPVDEEPPDGYTPTQRDLPVINRGDTVQVAVAPEETDRKSVV